MIPVGPLFNHPHTYKPFSTTASSLFLLLKTLPLALGTTPAKEIHQTQTESQRDNSVYRVSYRGKKEGCEQ